MPSLLYDCQTASDSVCSSKLSRLVHLFFQKPVHRNIVFAYLIVLHANMAPDPHSMPSRSPLLVICCHSLCIKQVLHVQTLERSYLLRVNGKVVERPQHMLMRVSVGIHQTDIDSAIQTYHLLSERWFTHASPTLFNAGTPRPQLSSCFLICMKSDSIEVGVCLPALQSWYSDLSAVHISTSPSPRQTWLN